jgi:hypothetical protein
VPLINDFKDLNSRCGTPIANILKPALKDLNLNPLEVDEIERHIEELNTLKVKRN